VGVQVDELIAGEVGYLAASIKAVADARVGDTITLKKQQAAEALAGDAAPGNPYHPLHGFRQRGSAKQPTCDATTGDIKVTAPGLTQSQCIYNVELCKQQIHQCFALIS